eukprot:692250_1
MHVKSIWTDLCLYLSICLVQILNVKADVPNAFIFCGDIINGVTNQDMASIYYTFINNLTNANEPGVYVEFSTCDSSYDTKLNLYDSDWSKIANCDEDTHHCSACESDPYHAQLITHTKLKDTLYFLEVTGYNNWTYGAFRLQIDCDFDFSFAGNYSDTYAAGNYNGTYDAGNYNDTYDAGNYNDTYDAGNYNDTYAYLDTKASLFCGDVINGITNQYTPSVYYTFINNLTNASDTGVFAQFSTCGSSYDTKLYLYDSVWTEISECDYFEPDCSLCDSDPTHARLATQTKLTDNLYFLEVTSYSPDSEYGAFQLQIDCGFSLTPVAPWAPCTVKNNQYICDCQKFGCVDSTIITCLDDMDCHLKCNGTRSCYDAVVVWPLTGAGSIECDGYLACYGINFPQPPPNDNYVIECGTLFECHEASIACPQNADCHLKCIGASACFQTHIALSINGTTTIECDGDRACNALKPLFNASAMSNANYVFECHDCFRSILNCPVYANCTVICISASSCHLTTINWSSEFVKSDLVCQHPSACDSATQPPKQYSYHFNKTYNVSQKVSETLHITEEFHISFVMKIDLFAQDSTYSLISIENEDLVSFKLWLYTGRTPNVFEIEFDNENVVFFLSSEQNIDDQLDHYFVINKTEEYYAFAMDSMYFNQPTADYVNPLASSYSMKDRNNSFTMHLGDNTNPQIEAHIHNITVVIDLYQYYQIEDIAESYVCFEQVKKSYVGMHVNSTMEYKYDYDSWYFDDYHDALAEGFYGTTSASTGALINFYLPIVAYFNGTIFMFDGYHNDRLYYDTLDGDVSFEFKWRSWTMTLFGQLALFSQSWTQIGDKVYFIGQNEQNYASGYYWNWNLTKEIVELDLTTKDYTYLGMWDCCSVSGSEEDYPNSDMWEFEPTYGSPLYHGSETSSLCDNITHLYHIYKANVSNLRHSNEQTIHIYNIATSYWTHSNESVFVSDSTNCQIYQPSQTMYLFGGRVHNGTHYVYSDRIYKYNISQDTVYSVEDKMDAPTINIKSMQKGIYIYLFSGSYFNVGTAPVQIFNVILETLFIAPDTFSVNIDSYYNDILDQIWVFDSNSMYYYHDDIILFDFSNSSNQTTVPGDSAAIFVDIFGCSLDAVEDAKNNTYSFSFTSENAAIGIQSTVIIENGACTQICDAYSICGDCETGLNPIISANADVQSISISIEAHNNNGNVKLATDTIKIFVSECPIGQGIESDALVIDCNECSTNTFKITTGNLPCYACPINHDGFHCDGSSVILIQYNYWFIAFNSSISQFISPFEIDLTSIQLHAVQCPPNYCCQSPPHCNYLASFISNGEIHEYDPYSAGICAINRDWSTPLCARCVNGTYELFGSVQCGECKDRIHLLWLLPIAFVTALFVIFLLFRSKREDLSIYTAEELDMKLLIRKDETQAVSILLMKVMIYYYQTLSQILGAKSVSHFLLPLLTIFNLSFENNSSSALGFCVFPLVSSPLLKLVLSSLTSIVFIGFNLFWIVIAWTTQHWIVIAERNRMVFVVVLKVITITAGTLLSLGFRLLSCVTLPGTNAFVHYYDSTSSCHGSFYWFMGLLMVIAVSLLFIIIFLQIRRQTGKERKNPNHIYYQFTKPFTESCWYFEFVLFIRRLIIAALTSFRISNSNDLDILLQTTLAMFL